MSTSMEETGQAPPHRMQEKVLKSGRPFEAGDRFSSGRPSERK